MSLDAVKPEGDELHSGQREVFDELLVYPRVAVDSLADRAEPELARFDSLPGEET